ncbi:MAG: molybdenum cofactor guanylyltransferase [Deltaproteobacteria bacterium]|jgi:molybdopterin-guanine dinucleotide biosynthesis protein A|nr:molybdenum cofactor guanylyltransferase [Deltaproteobacteria bacterium]
MVGTILAGGKSRRFGRNKSLEFFQGERLIERQVRTLRSLFPEVMIVTNTPELYLDLDVTIVQDIIPGLGPLGAIYTGLLFARGGSIFVTAVDMPFIQPEVIRRMMELLPGHDVIVPRLGDYLEPLHGMYSPRCLASVKRMLDRDELQVVRFFPSVKMAYLDEEEIRRLDPKGLSFFNINTPEDMAKAIEILGTGRG